MLNAYVNIRINLNLPLKVRAQEPSADLGNAAPIGARYCFLWSAGLVESGRPLDPHNAQSGIEVYVDVQDQAVRPSGECAKVCDGFCRYGDVAFNLDPHVVAVTEKKFFHILDCVGWVSHARSRSRPYTREC